MEENNFNKEIKGLENVSDSTDIMVSQMDQFTLHLAKIWLISFMTNKLFKHNSIFYLIFAYLNTLLFPAPKFVDISTSMW